jgi:hypothetical protein
MADTVRTKAALQTLFADNSTNNITPQMLRDFLVSTHTNPTIVEVDLGTNWIWNGKFTITDALITTTTVVQVWQAPGPYSGKGTSADQCLVEPIRISAVFSGTGVATVYWETPPITIDVTAQQNEGTRIITAGGTNTDLQTFSRRINRVRGNVKFYYTLQGV